jgi:hypothetical protein
MPEERGEYDRAEDLPLTRWSGLAAILAGVVLIVTILLTVLIASAFSALFGLVWLLSVVALPGLQARQGGRSRRLMLVGSGLATIGATILAIWMAFGSVSDTLFGPSSTTSGFLYDMWVLKGGAAFLVRLPIVLLLVGLALFGIATFRAGVRPRWGAALLALGFPLALAFTTSVPIVGLVGGGPFSYVFSGGLAGQVVSYAGLAVFAIGLIWLGYILQSERGAPPRWGILMLALGLFLALLDCSRCSRSWHPH